MLVAKIKHELVGQMSLCGDLLNALYTIEMPMIKDNYFQFHCAFVSLAFDMILVVHLKVSTDKTPLFCDYRFQ